MSSSIHTDHAPQAHRHLLPGRARRRHGLYLRPDPARSGHRQLVSGDIEAEIRRVFDNLKAIAAAAGGTLANAVKVTVFLTDLAHFAKVNEIMAKYFSEPYPARAAVGVAALPRGARVEMECILSLA